MHAIESKNNFKLEATALLAKIKDQIKSSANSTGNSSQSPHEGVVLKLNVLKNHEYKVKEALESVEKMQEEEWIAHKADLQKDFKEALEAFKTSTSLG